MIATIGVARQILTNKYSRQSSLMAFVGRYGPVARSIAKASESAKPINTKKAYQPKITEFKQFCDSIYGGEDNPRFVTEEKVYGFVSYHAHRTKLTTNKKKSISDEAVQRFDRLDYDKVLDLIESFDHEEADWSHFGDVGGFDMVNQYLCAVK